MKKEYVSPVVTSLRYMFSENIANTTEPDFDDPLVNASTLFPTP